MTGAPLRILLVEDNPNDAELIGMELARHGLTFTFERIETEEALRQRLSEETWDVILSDDNLPGFSGRRALEVVKEMGSAASFIAVSGAIGEDVAAEYMRAGAADYVLKQRLTRLGPAVEREVRELLNRVEQHQAVARAEGLARVVVENIPSAAIFVFDSDLRYLLAGGSALRDAGYSGEALLGKTLWEVLPPERAQALAPVYLAAISGQATDLTSEYGGRVYRTRAFPLRCDGLGEAGVLLAEDITEQQTVEEALRESEARYRGLYDNAPSAYFSVSASNGEIRGCNLAAAGLLGLDVQTLIGRNVLDMYADTPLGKEKAKEIFGKFKAGETIRDVELQMKRADGAIVDIDLIVYPKKDATGAVVESCSIAVDITERKHLRSQIAQSDRLASMGMLAAGVAHEINNPLAYILYNLESLTDDLPRLSAALRRCLDLAVQRLGDDEWARMMGPEQALLNPTMLADIHDRFKDALHGVHRIKDIARGLGTFSRVDEDRLLPVNLMHVIEAAINMVFNEIKYRSRLVKEYGKVSPVMASDGKLSQVFLNLLVNAAHAIEEGDVEGNEIRVRTWQEGEVVLAEVRDTGRGIAAEHIPHLFEPFFTTKEVGFGTGLGLSISKNIIEGCGGRIEVTSELGEGTSFVIRLPVRRAEEAEETIPARDAIREETVRGRILVIDDEEPIRAAMIRMLKEHEVVEAASGAAGMQILEEDQAFDLILCDMMMPAVSGVELHRWLVGAYPHLAKQVVFVTGGAFTPIARQYLARVSNLRVSKPFDAANFKKVVAELIVAYRARRS